MLSLLLALFVLTQHKMVLQNARHLLGLQRDMKLEAFFSFANYEFKVHLICDVGLSLYIMCVWTFTTEKFHTDMISKVMGCSSV